MAITLNHTIVPAKDKEASARHFAKLFGLSYDGPAGHFAPVRVNDTLTMDFDDRDVLESHHYAFHVNDEEFDQVFNTRRGGRVKLLRIWTLRLSRDAMEAAPGMERAVAAGSVPPEMADMQINTRRGGRGFYFKDLDGHVLELMTYN